MTKSSILQEANDEQQEAIKHQEGACMIIAGPGSGKTKTVVSRTQYMILNGISPSEICLFTFTNKAANEMKERIKSAVGDKANEITCGTYHSVGHKILRRYADKIGYNKNFTIISQDDCKKILKQIAEERGIEADLLEKYISSKKNKVILPQEAMASATNKNEQALSNGYNDYQKVLKRQMAMDFNDLILNSILLLENNTDVKDKINKRWKYITADEGHDSSTIDLKFIKLLGGESENVCYILDDNQSIYGFRGADIEAVMSCRYVYADMKIFNLSRNYRCSQTIVEASKSLISKNTALIDKSIRAARDYKGTPIVITKNKSQQEEALKTVQYIKALKKKGLNYKNIAVLYRTGSYSRTIEQALNSAKINCKIIGGTPFFNRAEVLDVLSYCRLVVNPHDVSSFKRAISFPKRGIGEKSLEKIDEFSLNYPGGPISIRDAIDKIELKGKAGKQLKELTDFLKHLDGEYVNVSPKELIEYICTKLDVITYLQCHPEYKKNWQERLANINELVTVASEYDNLEELLSQASLYSIEEDESENDAVNLLTMHSSKGLEYEAVIVVGCNEGVAPHYKSIGDRKAMEEERRLVYVAMTRAKDYLFMLFSDTISAQGHVQYSKPSRFLNEINEKYIYKN